MGRPYAVIRTSLHVGIHLGAGGPKSTQAILPGSAPGLFTLQEEGDSVIPVGLSLLREQVWLSQCYECEPRPSKSLQHSLRAKDSKCHS